MSPSIVIVLAASALGFAATGCYATAPPPAPVEHAAVIAPAYIESYPSVLHDGHPTYFYADLWWYRDGARWVHYETEPAELHRQRADVQRILDARWTEATTGKDLASTQ